MNHRVLHAWVPRLLALDVRAVMSTNLMKVHACQTVPPNTYESGMNVVDVRRRTAINIVYHAQLAM